MLEINLTRQQAQIIVTVASQESHRISWDQLVMTADRWQATYDDPPKFGSSLYRHLFPDDSLTHRSLVAATRPDNTERIVLVTGDDATLSVIPWEYLYDAQREQFVAARHSLVRAIPKDKRRTWQANGRLRVCALLSDPATADQPIAVQEAWNQLVETAQKSEKAVYLERLQPGTMVDLSKALGRQGTNIAHMVCHGNLAEDGSAILLLNDQFGALDITRGSRLIDTVRGRANMVILNSCLTAASGYSAFSNLAYDLVRDSVSYALGMQTPILEAAAFAMSDMFYDQLWQGQPIEEALRLAREAILNDQSLHNPAWLAGIPALYTALDEAAPPIPVQSGEADIRPDPKIVKSRQRLEGKPAEHLFGLGHKVVEIAQVLLQPVDRRPRFLTLKGMGGIGKTALVRYVAERLAWAFEWRVFWSSFEQLPSNPRAFLSELATFYLDQNLPNWTDTELQQRVITAIRNTKSLLIIDNLETLLVATIPDHTDGKPDPTAERLVTLLGHFAGGETALVLTSREDTKWAGERVIDLRGLSARDGAQVFRSRLSDKRRNNVLIKDAQALSIRVGGHPLSLRLLAGEFEQDSRSLAEFLASLEENLVEAEDRVPDSLYDRNRQRTLYACMEYSANRLPPHLKDALVQLSIFEEAFRAEDGAKVLDTDTGAISLQALEERGLLEEEYQRFVMGETIAEVHLYYLHPMVRWYIDWGLGKPSFETRQRFGRVLTVLIGATAEAFWENELLRTLARRCLLDWQRAGQYLEVDMIGVWSYKLATVLMQLGQPQEALRLYQQSLATDQQAMNIRGVSITQNAMASVLSQLGQPQEALKLYRKSLDISEQLEDTRGISITQNAMADILSQLGQPQEALRLYQQSLTTSQRLGDVVGVAATQNAMADILSQLGRPQEALRLYQQSLATSQELGDVRGVAITQNAMADILSQLGQPQEALRLYQQSLATKQELGDVREVSVTQHAIAGVLRELGQLQEALKLYQQSLATNEQLGDVRGVSITQNAIAGVLRELGQPQEALRLYQQSLATRQELGDVRGVSITEYAIAGVLRELGQLQEALKLYQQSLTTSQKLGDVAGVAATQNAMADILSQLGQPQEALKLYRENLTSSQLLGDVRRVAATQNAMAAILSQSGQAQEALKLYTESLATSQKLGDIRGVAVTQANMAQLLFAEKYYLEAIDELFQARQTLESLQSPQLIIQIDNLLRTFRERMDADQFDRFWETITSEPIPEFLKTSSHTNRGEITHQMLSVVVSNTIAVMTTIFEKRSEWLITIQDALKESQAGHFEAEVAFFQAIVACLRGEGGDLPADSAYYPSWEAIQAGIVIGGSISTIQDRATLGEHEQDIILQNTVAVMTATSSGKEEWHATLESVLATARNNQAQPEIDFFSAVLSLVKGETVLLPLNSPYANLWDRIQAGIAGKRITNKNVSPDTLDIIVQNTVDVLTSATDQRALWRERILNARNSANLNGDIDMADFLSAVVALLDAVGNVQSVKYSSTTYQTAWQQIRSAVVGSQLQEEDHPKGITSETPNAATKSTGLVEQEKRVDHQISTESFSLFPPENSDTNPDLMHQRAQQLFEENKWAAAHAIFEKNKVSYKELKNKAGFAKTLLMIGHCEHKMGNLERARWTYKDALSFFEAMDDERNIAITCYYLGRLEIQTTFFGEAKLHLKKAANFFALNKEESIFQTVQELLDSAVEFEAHQAQNEDWANKLINNKS